MRFRLSVHAAMIRAWAVILAVLVLYALVGCWFALEFGLAWWWGLLPTGAMLVFGEAVFLMTRGDPLGGREYRLLTRELDPRAHEALDRLCALSGRSRPELRLINLRHANALTLDDGNGGSVIYVSPRLITELELPELQAVLAHEMAHIAHRDQRLLQFATAMTRWPLHLPLLVLPFLQWVDGKVVAFGRRCGMDWEPLGIDEASAEQDQPIGEISNPVLRRLARPVLWAVQLLRLVAFLYGALFKLAFLVLGALIALPGLPAAFVLNRQRELAADRAAAELTGAPSTLASALDLLRVHRERRPARDLRAANVSALAIFPVDGKDGGGWFSTHPALSRRMKRLREQARLLSRQ
ncbi:M48 family metallopeptidase [Nocardiopsis nanhaiensis]